MAQVHFTEAELMLSYDYARPQEEEQRLHGGFDEDGNCQRGTRAPGDRLPGR